MSPPSAKIGSGASAAIAAKPSQPSAARPDASASAARAEHREVERERARPLDVRARVARRGAQDALGPGPCAGLGECRRGPVHAGAAPGARVARSPLSSTLAPRGRASATNASASARCRAMGQSFSRNWTSASPRSSAASARARNAASPSSLGHRDPVDRRQQQRAQHERVRGQQRRDVEASGHLPRERLPVVADGLAVPLEHAEEMQLDVRVRIPIPLHEPRRRAAHREAELLGQFAVERVPRRLAGLELAAREFPVAGVRLAGRTLREQHVAVRRAR